jgi:hypothetical protein
LSLPTVVVHLFSFQQQVAPPRLPPLPDGNQVSKFADKLAVLKYRGIASHSVSLKPILKHLNGCGHDFHRRWRNNSATGRHFTHSVP